MFLLQVGRLPNQGRNGRQLGAAPRMLEVTDCGTAVHHHARTCIYLLDHDRGQPNNNNNTTITATNL